MNVGAIDIAAPLGPKKTLTIVSISSSEPFPRIMDSEGRSKYSTSFWVKVDFSL